MEQVEMMNLNKDEIWILYPNGKKEMLIIKDISEDKDGFVFISFKNTNLQMNLKAFESHLIKS